jgi:hypothetical protein
MRRWPILALLAGATATAATAGAMTALPSAGASTQPGWRIWQVAGAVAPDSSYSAITALSASDAWVAGNVAGNAEQSPALTVKHWTGKAWSQVSLANTAVTARSGQATAIAASSPADALLVSVGEADSYGLRWNGTSWSMSTLAGAVISSDAIFGPANAWAFGYAKGTDADAVRYNGKAWKTTSMPVEAGKAGMVSTTGASDIWAVGVTTATAGNGFAAQVTETVHYNGTSWKAVPITGLHLPANETLDSPVVLARSSANVWVYSGLQGFRSGAGVVPITGAVLTHWNGKTWTRIAVPYSTEQTGSIAADGHGGVWLVAGSTGGQLDLYHYNAGKWTKTVTPTVKGYQADVFALALIPGTTSVWAAGELQSTKDNQDGRAAIWKYGA